MGAPTPLVRAPASGPPILTAPAPLAAVASNVRTGSGFAFTDSPQEILSLQFLYEPARGFPRVDYSVRIFNAVGFSQAPGAVIFRLVLDGVPTLYFDQFVRAGGSQVAETHRDSVLLYPELVTLSAGVHTLALTGVGIDNGATSGSLACHGDASVPVTSLMIEARPWP